MKIPFNISLSILPFRLTLHHSVAFGNKSCLNHPGDSSPNKCKTGRSASPFSPFGTIQTKRRSTAFHRAPRRRIARKKSRHKNQLLENPIATPHELSKIGLNVAYCTPFFAGRKGKFFLKYRKIRAKALMWRTRPFRATIGKIYPQ